MRDPKQWFNLRTSAWCYYNNSDSLGKIYGKLYNWYAVNDPRGLAPEGWHVPHIFELDELEDFVGDYNVSGGKLKEAGYIHWAGPNTGATNESRFTALPSGYLQGDDGVFKDLHYLTIFWPTVADIDSAIIVRYLFYRESKVFGYVLSRHYGLSVRCVKD